MLYMKCKMKLALGTENQSTNRGTWSFYQLEVGFTPERRQSKTLLTIDERGSKLARNSVFICHLSPIG